MSETPSRQPGSAPAGTRIETLSAADAGRYIGAVLASPGYIRFRDQLQRTGGDIFTPLEAELDSFLITVGQAQRVAVRVPVIGGAGGSFYGATLHPGPADIDSTISGVFSLDGVNTSAVMERDGTAALSAVISPSGDVLGGTLTTSAGATELDNLGSDEFHSLLHPDQNVSGFFRCLRDCLRSAGIPPWLVLGLAAVCASACVVTEGLACEACIALVTGASRAVIFHCISSCASAT
ncbi:MAG TPA: hypothetical protein VFO16_11590 [Pseudonocardiaceae bacterium]|nr:hypothetical protein [Pseudonocardiaceae bacterium]